MRRKLQTSRVRGRKYRKQAARILAVGAAMDARGTALARDQGTNGAIMTLVSSKSTARVCWSGSNSSQIWWVSMIEKVWLHPTIFETIAELRTAVYTVLLRLMRKSKCFAPSRRPVLRKISA